MRRHPEYNLTVSDNGRVFGPRGERVARFGTDGYLRINITRNKKSKTLRVHHLIADAYLGPRPQGYTVNHKNGCKTDNRVSNLEYVTSAENTSLAFRAGLVKTCKPVSVNGVYYFSAREAERQTGIPRRSFT